MGTQFPTVFSDNADQSNIKINQDKSTKLLKSKIKSKAKNKKVIKKDNLVVDNKEVKPKWKHFVNLSSYQVVLHVNKLQKKFHCCSEVEEEWKFRSLILAWGRERIFFLLGVLSLLICAILFTLQAYMTYRSCQIMRQLNVKKPVPEMLYYFYFDSHDWNLDKVDLRANTSIFIL